MSTHALDQPVPSIHARSPELGAIPGLAERTPASDSLEMFRRTCWNHYFEIETARVYQTGVMKIPIYLSLGQEHIPPALAMATRDFQIFAQHRGHSYYLTFGGDPRALVDELFGRPTGCARGMGGSASIHSPEHGIFGHSGLMGDQVPIAVGAALGSGRRTLTVVGDASVEEDYVFGAMGFAITKRAPVLFVCEDNDLSILTHVATRRSWNMTAVARALGMPGVDITDDPWLIAHHTRQMLDHLPAYLNIRTCRAMWHAGVGVDGPPEWDRFALIKAELARLGLGEQAAVIEQESKSAVEALWQAQLQKP